MSNRESIKLWNSHVTTESGEFLMNGNVFCIGIQMAGSQMCGKSLEKRLGGHRLERVNNVCPQMVGSWEICSLTTFSGLSRVYAMNMFFNN